MISVWKGSWKIQIGLIALTLLPIGGYLWIIFEVPIEFSIAGVFVGSLIAINILGFAVEEIIRRNRSISDYAEY